MVVMGMCNESVRGERAREKEREEARAAPHIHTRGHRGHAPFTVCRTVRHSCKKNGNPILNEYYMCCYSMDVWSTENRESVSGADQTIEGSRAATLKDNTHAHERTDKYSAQAV